MFTSDFGRSRERVEKAVKNFRAVGRIFSNSVRTEFTAWHNARATLRTRMASPVSSWRSVACVRLLDAALISLRLLFLREAQALILPLLFHAVSGWPQMGRPASTPPRTKRAAGTPARARKASAVHVLLV